MTQTEASVCETCGGTEWLLCDCGDPDGCRRCQGGEVPCPECQGGGADDWSEPLDDDDWDDDWRY